MSNKLPMTFWLRQRGRGQANYLAASTDQEDIYTLERPGMPPSQRYVGKIRIVPAGKGKQDGKGYTMPVMVGKSQRPGDAYWKPQRPIDPEWKPLVEGVSVQRVTHPDGGLVYMIRLNFDTDGRSAVFGHLPKIQARQLHAQLDQYFGKKHFD